MRDTQNSRIPLAAFCLLLLCCTITYAFPTESCPAIPSCFQGCGAWVFSGPTKEAPLTSDFYANSQRPNNTFPASCDVISGLSQADIISSVYNNHFNFHVLPIMWQAMFTDGIPDSFYRERFQGLAPLCLGKLLLISVLRDLQFEKLFLHESHIH